MKTLNLGILAHVDAGKTSLTERLLYIAGVIDEIGSVDAGNTQTDSLALERQRGITIKSAVASFVVGDTKINLIDTPGHPDFIAEVERVLTVLDGVVLVISAVEGVQPQTRVLMRTLQRLQIPTILFVNKIDRGGARYDDLLKDITEKLALAITPMGSVTELGTHSARFVPYSANQSGEHPVFFGSAITGAGVDELFAAIPKLLPTNTGRPGDPVSGTVFKIERGRSGEKIAYVRMFSGVLRVREQVSFGAEKEGRITAISIFDHGSVIQSSTISAGAIGKVWGLGGIQIGDALGTQHTDNLHYFAPPTLETAIVSRNPADKGKLYAALDQLAEQDPLINLRQDDIRQEIYVSLYGEVQKEVIEDVLVNDYGIAIEFRATTTVCVERPVGSGAVVEIGKRYDPFLATVGLSVVPTGAGTGVKYVIASEALGQMPAAFYKAVEDTVQDTLRQGLLGWQVTDCLVTMTRAGYFPRQSHAHARFDKSMSSTGADFRGLTPLVLMSALKQAGTIVCEPVHRFELEVPHDTLSVLLPVLASKFGASVQTTAVRGSSYLLQGDIPAGKVHQLQQQLPALTSGEGTLEYLFDRYEPVRGVTPVRPRTDNNPLDRREYMLSIMGKG